MGLWSNGMKRSESGEKRLENMTPFERYLKDVEWVDLGHDVLYARFDYPLDYLTNEESLMSVEDIKEILDVLPEDISIMNKNHVKFLQDNCKITLYQDVDEKIRDLYTSILCVNPQTKEYISFNLDMCSPKQNTTYFLKEVDAPETNDQIKSLYFRYIDMIEVTEIGPKKFPSYLGTVKRAHVPKTQSEAEIKKYMIKVVKLKDDGVEI